MTRDRGGIWIRGGDGMTVKVAIVEDQEQARSHMKECLDYITEKEGTQFAVTEFENGLEFVSEYKAVYDIVLMDIEMPGMDGMAAAEALRLMDESVILIFVTSMAQYAIQGYAVDALDYILKPVNKYSFAIKMKRALGRITKRTEEYISVKCDGEIRQLEMAAIRYLDIDGHYIVYHTLSGNIAEYGTLKEACSKLNSAYFVNVNRSCVVNLNHVNAVSRDCVTVGEVRLDISRPQRKNFLAAMSVFMGKNR